QTKTEEPSAPPRCTRSGSRRGRSLHRGECSEELPVLRLLAIILLGLRTFLELEGQRFEQHGGREEEDQAQSSHEAIPRIVRHVVPHREQDEQSSGSTPELDLLLGSQRLPGELEPLPQD